MQIKSITEVSGLKMEQDVIELKQNGPDGKYIIKKLPGRRKAGEVTLTRGLTGDNSFEKWIKDSQFGKMSDARKGGAIIVFDYEGAAIKRYKLTNAWPKSLEIGVAEGRRHQRADREARRHLRAARGRVMRRGDLGVALADPPDAASRAAPTGTARPAAARG